MKKFLSENKDIISILGSIILEFLDIKQDFSIFKYVSIALPILIAVYILIQIIKDIRYFMLRQYYRTIDNNPQYYGWHIEVLKKIYGKEHITSMFNQEFSSFHIKSPENTELNTICLPIDYSGYESRIKHNDIDVICKKKFISIKRVRELFKGRIFFILELKYKIITYGTVRYPNLTGFMLDKYYFCDKKENTFTKIGCKLGTYKQNIFSSHILEYEMYKAYKKLSKKDNITEIPDNILQMLPYRNQIHISCKNDINEVLYSGKGRFSLLSVQLMIIYYDSDKKEYCTLIKKRATHKLATKLGYYQIVPAGGFELYEKETHLYNIPCINYSYDIKYAIYRELLEELFNIETFEGVCDININNDTKNLIRGDERIQLIESCIKNGNAEFALLGSSVELVSLRHCLSCVLRVDDPEFKNRFIVNTSYNKEFSAFDGIESSIALQNIENTLKNKIIITPDSIALYSLVKESIIYKKIKENNFKQIKNEPYS